MPAVNGILETALYVDDLDRASGFYRDTMGLEVLFEDSRLCAFDAGHRSVLLLFARGASQAGAPVEGGFIPAHDGTGPVHFAFAISAEDVSEWEAHLFRCGIDIESRVHPPRGGVSLYFRDPDGHLVELATPGIWPVY